MKDKLHGRKTLQVNHILDDFEKEEIERRIDIVRLFESFGVQLKKKGKSYVGLCPWHDDRNPSLSVDADKKVYHCFGCGESGNMYALVKKMKGIEFGEAKDFLREFAGIRRNDKLKMLNVELEDKKENGKLGKREENGKLEKESLPVMDETMEKESGSTEFTESGAELLTTSGMVMESLDKEPVKGEEINEQKDTEEAGEDKETVEKEKRLPEITLTTIAEYYHKKLYDNPKAVEFLKKRGFLNPANYSRFQIGFCDGSLLDIVSEGQKEELKRLGIVNERGREHFWNCLVFPILDDEGNVHIERSRTVTGMYGRSIF
jgi:DNA primase